MAIDLSVIMSTITLVVTVSYYYRMVVLMEASQEASLFDTLHSEYAKPEILDAFALIDDFSQAYYEDDLVCSYVEEKLKKTEKGKAIDAARRRILHWYHKVVYFHKFGLLHPRYFKEFPGPNRALHFVEAVEPFALASCVLYEKENCSAPFDYIRSVYGLPQEQLSFNFDCAIDARNQIQRKKPKSKTVEAVTDKNNKDEL